MGVGLSNESLSQWESEHERPQNCVKRWRKMAYKRWSGWKIVSKSEVSGAMISDFYGEAGTKCGMQQQLSIKAEKLDYSLSNMWSNTWSQLNILVHGALQCNSWRVVLNDCSGSQEARQFIQAKPIRVFKNKEGKWPQKVETVEKFCPNQK